MDNSDDGDLHFDDHDEEVAQSPLPALAAPGAGAAADAPAPPTGADAGAPPALAAAPARAVARAEDARAAAARAAVDEAAAAGLVRNRNSKSRRTIDRDDERWNDVRGVPGIRTTKNRPLTNPDDFKKLICYNLNPHRPDNCSMIPFWCRCRQYVDSENSERCNASFYVGIAPLLDWIARRWDPWEFRMPSRCKLHGGYFPDEIPEHEERLAVAADAGRAGGGAGADDEYADDDVLAGAGGAAVGERRRRTRTDATLPPPPRRHRGEFVSRGAAVHAFEQGGAPPREAHVLGGTVAPRLEPMTPGYSNDANPNRNWLDPSAVRWLCTASLCADDAPSPFPPGLPPMNVTKVQIESRNYILCGKPPRNGWCCFLPDLAEPTGNACAVGTRYVLRLPGDGGAGAHVEDISFVRARADADAAAAASIVATLQAELSAALQGKLDVEKSLQLACAEGTALIKAKTTLAEANTTLRAEVAALRAQLAAPRVAEAPAGASGPVPAPPFPPFPPPPASAAPSVQEAYQAFMLNARGPYALVHFPPPQPDATQHPRIAHALSHGAQPASPPPPPLWELVCGSDFGCGGTNNPPAPIPANPVPMGAQAGPQAGLPPLAMPLPSAGPTPPVGPPVPAYTAMATIPATAPPQQPNQPPAVVPLQSGGGPASPPIAFPALRDYLARELSARCAGTLLPRSNQMLGYTSASRTMRTHAYRTPTQHDVTTAMQGLLGEGPMPVPLPDHACTRATLASLRRIFQTHTDRFTPLHVWNMCGFVIGAELHGGPHWRPPMDSKSPIPPSAAADKALQFHIAYIPPTFFDPQGQVVTASAAYRLLQTHFAALYPGITLHSFDLFQFHGWAHQGQQCGARLWLSHTAQAELLAYDQFTIDFECGDALERRLQSAHTLFLPFNYVEVRLGGTVHEYVMFLHYLAPTLFDARTVCSLISAPFRALLPGVVWGVRPSLYHTSIIDPAQVFYLIVDGHEAADLLYETSLKLEGFPLWPCTPDDLFATDRVFRAVPLEYDRGRPTLRLDALNVAFPIRHLYSKVVRDATRARLAHMATTDAMTAAETELFLLHSVSSYPEVHWAPDLRRVTLPRGLTFEEIIYHFATEASQMAFLTFMLTQLALYRTGDTDSMNPHFYLIPYALPPHLAASTRELDRLDMPDPGSADELSWIPACPPTIADEAALDRVAARVAGHSLHQFDPMFQKGTAVLMDLTYGFEFGRAIPINRPRFHKLLLDVITFIQSCPQGGALLQPLAMQTGLTTQEPVPYNEPFEREPTRQLALWARESGCPQDELYCVIQYGLRHRHLLQTVSRNFILLTVLKPYTPPDSYLARTPPAGRGRGSTGRGRGQRSQPPAPNPPQLVPSPPPPPARAAFGRGAGPAHRRNMPARPVPAPNNP